MMCVVSSAEAGKVSEAKKVEEKSFNLRMGGYIFLEGNDGRINIQVWDKEEVHIIMTKRAWGKTRRRAEENLEKIEVYLEQRGDRLYIRDLTENIFDEEIDFLDLFKPSTWKNRGLRVDFDLTVPRSVRLDISNDEGNIDISGVNGDIRVETDEGNIEAYDIISNNVNIDIDEGDIFLTNINVNSDTLKGRIDINTDEGRIKFRNCKAKNFQIDSDEGDILLYEITAGKINIYTDEGDIESELNVVENGHYRMRTDEGDIVVLLSENPNIRVDLEALEGSIRTDFRVRIEEDDDTERARGVIGTGGALLILKTDEGNITLEERW